MVKQRVRDVEDPFAILGYSSRKYDDGLVLGLLSLSDFFVLVQAFAVKAFSSKVHVEFSCLLWDSGRGVVTHCSSH